MESVPILFDRPQGLGGQAPRTKGNRRTKVLRITYGPREKSVPHVHPANVAVFLTDGQTRFTMPDGKTVDAPVKAGSTQWDPGGVHQPENTGEKPFELILVELKTKPAAAR